MIVHEVACWEMLFLLVHF